MTDFDQEAFELALAQERDDLNLAIFSWDPNSHPRDLLGKFKGVLGGMKEGQKVELPDSTSVKKTGRTFVVSPAGAKSTITMPTHETHFDNPIDAADHALHVSTSTDHSSEVSTVADKIGGVAKKAFDIWNKTQPARDVVKSDSSLKAENKSSLVWSIISEGIGRANGDQKTFKAVTNVLDGWAHNEIRRYNAQMNRQIAKALLGGLSKKLNKVAMADESDADLELSGDYDLELARACLDEGLTTDGLHLKARARLDRASI